MIQSFKDFIVDQQWEAIIRSLGTGLHDDVTGLAIGCLLHLPFRRFAAPRQRNTEVLIPSNLMSDLSLHAHDPRV